MGYKVFGGCSNLESANYPVNWVNSPSGNGSNSYEYGNVFSGCPKLTEIEIPEGVKVIAPHSFASLTTLTSVTLPSSLTEIGAYAFAGATGLTEVTLPSNTKTIRDYAFADCAGLKDIYIPDSTTDIRKAVFENCPQLTIHCSYYSMATIYAIENNIPMSGLLKQLEQLVQECSKFNTLEQWIAPKPSWIVQAPAITETSEVPQPMDMWP